MELGAKMWPVLVRRTPDVVGVLGAPDVLNRDQGGGTRSPKVAGVGWGY